MSNRFVDPYLLLQIHHFVCLIPYHKCCIFTYIYRAIPNLEEMKKIGNLASKLFCSIESSIWIFFPRVVKSTYTLARQNLNSNLFLINIQFVQHKIIMSGPKRCLAYLVYLYTTKRLPNWQKKLIAADWYPHGDHDT